MSLKSLSSGDWAVFLVYFVIVSLYGWWVYKRKNKSDGTSKGYFLAEGSLTWWAIGASLIASNISAEQMVGMSGSGFKMGLAISTYEWMAAATLVIVAVFFIPVYLKNKIATMPQFLHQRYNGTVAMIMAIFWLMLYIVVNLMSILYLGGVAIAGISGLDLKLVIFLLAVFSIIITLGGMKVIGYTDVIQVFFLVLGGLAATYIALHLISEKSGTTGLWNGFKLLRADASDHFQMIFHKGNANYLDLPGLSVLIGGMWITNLNYWGCNQYITQRALGADLKTARSGILFAAFLKLLMPVIVVLPGIAAYVLYQKGMFHQEMLSSKGVLDVNKAYPSILNLLPNYLKGLSFAALTAAIVASLAGKANSIATIFTLDIYKKAINTRASEKNLVNTGKVAVVVSMILGVLLSFVIGDLLMGEGKQGFQYIQEYTGFVSPGIFAMFILGFFWKKATSNAALFATIGGLGFAIVFKFLPYWTNLSWLSPFGFSKLNGDGVYEIPFLDRMGFVFIICLVGMYVISMIENARGVKTTGLEVDVNMFKTNRSFAIGAIVVAVILTFLYTFFW
ncbi:sodium/solute symporter [Mucilaginibacter sp. L3T2-6]|uniref:sodium:solute symporter family transporter n=1 Tax=Mucilaginibacter sp. L3T2-6 TaxID=3062491 RepID=UPI00267485DE|nr:sodium/solute symporter [Mucilaginibacter sp. L3T2-6]MDO3644142.1 sodium/solute symporter [Mucilaginibacter sp. L3T2-6]MDV6216577.1 sodium/solute symporter [Mucilaginibacter sp. L3T2-6]